MMNKFCTNKKVGLSNFQKLIHQFLKMKFGFNPRNEKKLIVLDFQKNKCNKGSELILSKIREGQQRKKEELEALKQERKMDKLRKQKTSIKQELLKRQCECCFEF